MLKTNVSYVELRLTRPVVAATATFWLLISTLLVFSPRSLGFPN